MSSPLPGSIQPPNNPFGNSLFTAPNAQGVIDLAPSLKRVTGRDVLSQSLLRRLTTARGSVIDSPNDCVDVRSWLSESFTPGQQSQLGNVIQNEILKDQRITSCSVTATMPATYTLQIVASLTSGYGPFTLTLQVSQVTVAMLVANQ